MTAATAKCNAAGTSHELVRKARYAEASPPGTVHLGKNPRELLLSLGGFASEYEKKYLNQHVPESQAIAAAHFALNVALKGEVNRRYSSTEYEFFGETYETNYLYVTDNYGTSLSALCRVTYIFPLLSGTSVPTASGWSLIVLALLLLVGGKVYFGRRAARAKFAAA
ncbi:MAG: hypothetical protein IH987_13995 [Planctomycetes bacterium]|nr:hypothetical protein [Planctomycetota bacterium]